MQVFYRTQREYELIAGRLRMLKEWKVITPPPGGMSLHSARPLPLSPSKQWHDFMNICFCSEAEPLQCPVCDHVVPANPV